MGARGPRPKPTVLRILEGNKGKRPLPRNEPQPPRAKPSPPAYLNAYAREEWDRLANTLHAIGALTAIDQNSFASYCMAYSRWRQAEEDLQRMAQMDAFTHGAVLKTKAGNFIQNPLLGVVNTLRRDMQRWAREFGLSPSARTQIEAAPLPANDAISRKYFS